MEEISQEAQTRMAKLIRDYVAACAHCTVGGQFLTEARAIVAMLPTPPNPDEAEARAIFAKHYPGARYESAGTKELAAGIECIRRGRELAAARAGEGSV